MKSFQTIEAQEIIPNCFMKPALLVIHKPERHYKNNKRRLQTNIPNEYKYKILTN